MPTTVFHNDWPDLQSHQWCTRTSFSPTLSIPCPFEAVGEALFDLFSGRGSHYVAQVAGTPDPPASASQMPGL